MDDLEMKRALQRYVSSGEPPFAMTSTDLLTLGRRQQRRRLGFSVGAGSAATALAIAAALTITVPSSPALDSLACLAELPTTAPPAPVRPTGDPGRYSPSPGSTMDSVTGAPTPNPTGSGSPGTPTPGSASPGSAGSNDSPSAGGSPGSTPAVPDMSFSPGPGDIPSADPGWPSGDPSGWPSGDPSGWPSGDPSGWPSGDPSGWPSWMAVQASAGPVLPFDQDRADAITCHLAKALATLMPEATFAAFNHDRPLEATLPSWERPNAYYDADAMIFDPKGQAWIGVIEVGLPAPDASRILPDPSAARVSPTAGGPQIWVSWRQDTLSVLVYTDRVTIHGYVTGNRLTEQQLTQLLLSMPR